MPLHAGVTGKALLVLDAKKQKTSLRQGHWIRFAQQTITDRKRLDRQLKEIRTRGFAITRGERFPNTASVAVPVFGSHGEVLGALAVIGLSERLTHGRLREITPVLMEEAHLLTERLSCTVSP